MMFRVFSMCAMVALTIQTPSCYAQYAPSVGQTGTTAMFKDSSAFVAWATSCQIIRGFQDISIPSNGYTNVGDSTSVYGIAGTTGVVSLGDGGYATARFNNVIVDGEGPDLAVFENSFDDLFLELAFVEVSSNGIDFFRFPATSLTDTLSQTGSFAFTDATKINNMAGKYRGLYGTPFDLADIPDHILLDKNAVTHVRVRDVVGCIQNQYCTRDAGNHKINDPWPTSFGSGGFDLDAIGVIHQQTATGLHQLNLAEVFIYPNPAIETLTVTTNISDYTARVFNLFGQEVITLNHSSLTSVLPISNLPVGVYILRLETATDQKTVHFIKQ